MDREPFVPVRRGVVEEESLAALLLRYCMAPGPGIAPSGHLPMMIIPRTSSLVTSWNASPAWHGPRGAARPAARRCDSAAQVREDAARIDGDVEALHLTGPQLASRCGARAVSAGGW